jgi:hypothetical protein
VSILLGVVATVLAVNLVAVCALLVHYRLRGRRDD